MGRFMIPVCCVCGVAAKFWDDPAWRDGGLQDFCPYHANLIRSIYGEFTGYLVPHLTQTTIDSEV